MKKAAIVLLILLIISLLAVDIHFSSSYEEYSMYNSNWNGTSLFTNDAFAKGAIPVEDYKILKSAYNSTLLIIEPNRDFTPDELRILREFKNNQNTVFISDERGQAGDLLKVLGTDISVERKNLLSIDREYNNPGFIISYVSGNDSMTSGVRSIALDRPSVATGGKSLITTSFLSWIDENNNLKADSSESIGKRGVFVKSGNVYLLSDSGIFINSLYKDINLKDNRKFILNLLESSNTIYIENIHSEIASETSALKYLNLIRKNEMVKAAASIIILLSLLFIFRGKNDNQ